MRSPVRSLTASAHGIGTDYSSTATTDALGRMSDFTGPGLPASGARYFRQDHSELIRALSYPLSMDQSGGWTRQFESNRDLIASVENQWPGANQEPVTISKYAYQNDSLGRRTSVVRTGTAFDQDHFEIWGYNPRNELTNRRQYEGTDVNDTSTTIYGSGRTWAYDAIGNRTTSTAETIEGATTTYNRNAVNQYTSTVFGQAGFDPQTICLWYDADGNMTNTASPTPNSANPTGLPNLPGFDFTWDAENRLKTVTPHRPQPGQPQDGVPRVVFTYDYLGRRVRKQTFAWNAGTNTWNTTPAKDIRFVYDGWNLVMELDGLSSNAILCKYTWGLDLSGTPQGAGGIGGLLAMQDTKGTASTADDASYLYFYDANGNVGQLLDGSGAIAAKYEYDPYGNLTLAGGDAAATNPFRFSTKYFDVETGLYYYGYRYYLPGLGRWASRDPIEELASDQVRRPERPTADVVRPRMRADEQADENPYNFSQNTPLNHVDPVGLSIWQDIVDTACRCCAASAGGLTLAEVNHSGIDHTNSVKGGRAFRHCLAACYATKICGRNCAQWWWDKREKNPAERNDKLGLFGNDAGYECANTRICWDCCMDKWKKGRLWCFPVNRDPNHPDKLVPCPPP